MVDNFLEFEEPIADLEKKLKELKSDSNFDSESRNKLELKIKEKYLSIYSKLSPWQKVQVARHQKRPHTIDYINSLFTDFVYLAGDRKYAEDKSIISGLAKFNNKSIIIIGTEKGNSAESRIKHNFGMAKPEGYRKAQRLFKLANNFNLPIITFIDTPGAYPGKEAEERGQAEAIAKTISLSLQINTPMISIIIGEGGSGGAIALGTADKILMLENSIYSVISPEGCASILWRDPQLVKSAAESLKLTSDYCLKFGVIDEIIPELPGGAHRNFESTIKAVGNSISKNLNILSDISKEKLVSLRNEKYLNITSKIT